VNSEELIDTTTYVTI